MRGLPIRRLFRYLEAALEIAPSAFLPCAGLALVPLLAFGLASAYLEPLVPYAPKDLLTALIWLLLIVVLALALAGALGVVAVATAKIADDRIRGEKPDPERSLQFVLERPLPAIVGGIAFATLVGLGFLLVVPGALLLVLWYAWPQTLVLEYLGWRAAFRRAATVGAGHRLALLAAAIPILVPALLLAGAAVVLVADPWLEAVLLALVGAAALPLLVFVGGAAYRDAQPLETPAAAPATDPGAPRVRYTCPGCGRLYFLPASPPLGTLCPACRAAQAPASR